MPVVAVATISVTASAYYYTAFLVYAFFSQGALALTFALYAVCARDVGRLPPNLRFTLKLSGCLGAVAIPVLVLGAPVIMGVFGSEYSANAATVLQILAFSTLFVVVKDHYVAIARIRGNVRSAAKLCVAGAALELGLATCGGAYGGLTWFAFGWVVALGIEAIVMGPTVIRAAEWKDSRGLLSAGLSHWGSRR
jgi:O-antigen/teichoic acid export membrane protein